MSDAGIVSIVELIDQETKIDIRFYDIKEHKTLRNKYKLVLRECRLSHPTKFVQSKKEF